MDCINLVSEYAHLQVTTCTELYEIKVSLILFFRVTSFLSYKFEYLTKRLVTKLKYIKLKLIKESCISHKNIKTIQEKGKLSAEICRHLKFFKLKFVYNISLQLDIRANI